MTEKEVRKILEDERNRPSERIRLLKTIKFEEANYSTPQSTQYDQERVQGNNFAKNSLETFVINKHHKIEQMKIKAEQLMHPDKKFIDLLRWLEQFKNEQRDYYTIINSYYFCKMSDEDISLERAREGATLLTKDYVRNKRNRIIKFIAKNY